MIMMLPENNGFTYKEKRGKVFIEHNTLKINGRINYKKMMYEIAYELKFKDKCNFCSSCLNKDKCTMDHLYPRCMGGIEIPENLEPVCEKCNNRKGCLNRLQYFHLLSLDEVEQETSISKIEKRQEYIKKQKGFDLPEDWIEYVTIDDIVKNGKAWFTELELKKAEKFFEKYNKIPWPVILDKNYKIIHGKEILVLINKKENYGRKIPAIILENVEAV